jgi:hypothetical protein
MDRNAGTQPQKPAEHRIGHEAKTRKVGTSSEKVPLCPLFPAIFFFYTDRSLGETDVPRGLCVSPKWSVDIKSVKTTAIGMIFSPSAVRTKAAVRKLQSSNYENYFRPEIVNGMLKGINISC